VASEIFISSCSRRELARRRPGRGVAWLPFGVALIVLALVVGCVMALGGTI
jgi:hypothetical protein